MDPGKNEADTAKDKSAKDGARGIVNCSSGSRNNAPRSHATTQIPIASD